MSQLLMFLNNLKTDLKFREDLPNIYPFNQAVNRVDPNFENPFHIVNKCGTIADIKKLKSTKSFEDICAYKVESLELMAWAYGLPIYIYWSGGIDSTTAVVSFLKYSRGLGDVHIVCSQESIREYKALWPVIVKNFKGRIHSSFEHVEYYTSRAIVVTGEHGDQIFGSDLIKKVAQRFGEPCIFEPYHNVVPGLLESIFQDKNRAVSLYERIQPTLAHSEFPIISTFDWVWWYNFTNKWQHVKYRLLLNQTWKYPRQRFRNIVHFFDDKEFQWWAMNNPDKKIQKSLETYKFTAKEFIVEYTKHTDYLKKPKVGSLNNLWMNKKIYDGVTTDFEFLTLMEVSKFLR